MNDGFGALEHVSPRSVSRCVRKSCEGRIGDGCHLSDLHPARQIDPCSCSVLRVRHGGAGRVGAGLDSIAADDVDLSGQPLGGVPGIAGAQGLPGVLGDRLGVDLVEGGEGHRG